MIVQKLETNKIHIESENGLLYIPSQQAYKIVECSCSDLQYIEELEEKPEHIAEMLSL